jgi:hypothetical protein
MGLGTWSALSISLGGVDIWSGRRRGVRPGAPLWVRQASLFGLVLRVPQPHGTDSDPRSTAGNEGTYGWGRRPGKGSRTIRDQ